MTKISELPNAGPLTGAELVPMVQGGLNVKGPLSDFMLTNEAPQSATGPSAYFGIESADLLVDGPGRGISLPANAFLLPVVDQDWMIIIHCSTGQEFKTGTLETLASKGSSDIVGSSSNTFMGVYERGAPNRAGQSIALEFGVTINDVNRDLLNQASPLISDQRPIEFGKYCLVVGVSGGMPQFAYCDVGGHNPRFFASSAPNIMRFDSYYFGTAVIGTNISRSNNVATINLAGLPSIYTTGLKLLVKSTDVSFDGFHTITRNGSTGFTFPSIGPDVAPIASPQFGLQRTRTEIFKMLGRYQNEVAINANGWAGGIYGAEMRLGTMPLINGKVDQNWLRGVADLRISRDELPGALRWGSALNPLNLAPYAGSTLALPATNVGAVRNWRNGESSFLSIDVSEPDKIYASEFYSDTGTVQQSFSYFGAMRGLVGYIATEDGTVIVAETVIADADDMAQGRGVFRIAVPMGDKYYLHGRSIDNPNYNFVFGPFGVGPIGAIVQQSTLAGLFSVNIAGGGGTMVPGPRGTVIDVSGTVTEAATGNYTDQANFSRVIQRRTNGLRQDGNGIIAANDKMSELLTSQYGRAVPSGFANLTRSGHFPDVYWADRRRFINFVGTALPGVPLTGSWLPHPMYIANAASGALSGAGSSVWTKLGTVRLYKGGSFALSNPMDPYSDYVLTRGTLVATLNDLTGNWVGSVSGSFDNTSSVNDDTNFSITDAAGGDFYIAAEMEYDTRPGDTGVRLFSDGFTAFGDDEIENSGHISNVLRTMERASYVHYSWGNYLLSYAAQRSQADVNAKVVFDVNMLRRRFDKYPSVAGLPWVIALDPRTRSGGSLAEHRIREALRNYADTHENTEFAIGAIGAELDGLTSPHTHSGNPMGTRLVGLVTAHGVAAAMGIAGANGEEVFPTSAVRQAANVIEVTFNVPAGKALANGGGEPDSNWVGATPDTMALLDLPNHDTIFVGTDKIQITKANGNFPAVAYYNYGYGVAIIDTTLAAENARLPNMLFLNNGGYDGVVPGTPVQAAPSSLLVS